ncbi:MULTISPECIES: hypothetical protein [Psychromonas]|uniref:hypothetical protein n=1 Tax=Psychromonas TaxID=67572 RepID=UPI0004056E3A|nr:MULTISPECIES: hypothetical protein [Psychromonas]MBB1273730.1 hypothetical protein [Psychromonas sp. SR45-3]
MTNLDHDSLLSTAIYPKNSLFFYQYKKLANIQLSLKKPTLASLFCLPTLYDVAL